MSAASTRDPLKAQLRQAFDLARQQTDALFAVLDDDTLYERPIPLRHRLVFYVGHFDVFDWNKLCSESGLGKKASSKGSVASSHQSWLTLFAAGIDPQPGQAPADTRADWPSLEELRPWLRRTRAEVDEVLAIAPLEGWLEEGWLPRLLIEHRQMHFETLCYLLAQLSPEKKHADRSPLFSKATGHFFRDKPRSTTPAHTEMERVSWVMVPEGEVTLGQPEPFLGWDNEYLAHRVPVPGFRLQRGPVSNEAFLRFIKEGGYENRALWSDADWQWLAARAKKHPECWVPLQSEWLWRGVLEHSIMDWQAPVYVSHAEACAYARWMRGRLMREEEWHLAQAARTACDLDENGWEWTSTVFAPFAGFSPLPFYPTYSAGFFDGQHFVLKGSSPATPPGLRRQSFRNWFQPHYPYVFAKFRVAYDPNGLTDRNE